MKIRHLKNSREFTEVLESGEKWRGSKLSLHAVKTGPEGGQPGVGIIISRKVAPSAVRRNYMRRLIYAYFSEKKKDLATGFKTVIRVSADVTKDSRKTLSGLVREELDALTKKAGIKT